MAHNNPTTVPPMTAIFTKERKLGKVSKKIRYKNIPARIPGRAKNDAEADGVRGGIYFGGVT